MRRPRKRGCAMAAPDPNRIMMWRFPEAPPELQALYKGANLPEWIVLVPRSVWGLDIDELITKQHRPDAVSRFELPNGDITYIGAVPMTLDPRPGIRAFAVELTPRM